MNTQDIIDKYGDPGTRQVYCRPAYPLQLAWDRDVSISRFSCHSAVRARLEVIFEDTLNIYGLKGVQELGLDIFGGCLNVRKQRNGNDLSLHSWGLAVDLHPEHNKLKWGKDRAKFAHPDYKPFWETVEKLGGYSMGRVKNYDWMHFQFVPIN